MQSSTLQRRSSKVRKNPARKQILQEKQPKWTDGHCGAEGSDWDGEWRRYSGGTAVRKRCTNMVTHVLSSPNHPAKTGAKPEGAEKTETQLVCSPALLRPHVFEKGSVFTNCVNRHLPCKCNASLWHQRSGKRWQVGSFGWLSSPLPWCGWQLQLLRAGWLLFGHSFAYFFLPA